jgi:hypothetical protein
MKSFLLFVLSLSLVLGSVSCTTTDSNLTMHGIPKWIAGGAKLDREPAPNAPDPAIIHYDRTSAPVRWSLNTDNRDYPEPLSASNKAEVDPLERGRDYRIKRLVR